MRKIVSLLLIYVCFLSCTDKVEPDVATYYLSDSYASEEIESANRAAAQKLFSFYQSSDKKKFIYEVVASWGDGQDILLNYCPSKLLLTASGEICNGWGRQYQNVTVDKLEELANLNLSFNEYGTILEPVPSDEYDVTVWKSNLKCAR